MISKAPKVVDQIITIEDLNNIMPFAPMHRITQFHSELNEHLSYHHINTPTRIAAFIANGAVDTFELQELTDELNYSASRILQKWPERFKSLKDAQACAYNPEKLGNYLFANKCGNGNIYSGDGYKYRGRGFFKGVGRAYYQKMSEKLAVNFLSNPDLITAPVYCVLCACALWSDLDINTLMDTENMKMVFKKLSGSSNIPEKVAYYQKALKTLGVNN